MKKMLIVLLLPILLLFLIGMGEPTNENFSEETQACIDCHINVTPGIVNDWKSSLHYSISPNKALTKAKIERRISSENIPDNLKKFNVGCYECHSLNPDLHKDNFEHFGYQINVVVSPNDCATCHQTEHKQYMGSKKAHAVGNLRKNQIYSQLVETYTQVVSFNNDKLSKDFISTHAQNQSCFACHGTEISVDGLITKSTSMGDIEVPNLKNWPNQGVGRINPDGSKGACASCHPRHSFSIEIARKPSTCGQCHLEPDVPAYNVYKESKHGNIYESKKSSMNFSNVPWVIGKDISVPTCATCHNSLIVNPDGDIVAERTHDFGSRLWERIFGLIYAHSQPIDGETHKIINNDKQPMPTTFSNVPAEKFLINNEEKQKRKEIMGKICRNCHSSQWTDSHFANLDTIIVHTNKMTATATKLMQSAWNKKIQNPDNPFDETIEQLWVKQWLIYSNSIRYAAAMSGPDYAGFKNGWYDLNNNLQNMKFLIDLKKK